MNSTSQKHRLFLIFFITIIALHTLTLYAYADIKEKIDMTVDFQLGDGGNSISLYLERRENDGKPVPSSLITAPLDPIYLGECLRNIRQKVTTIYLWIQPSRAFDVAIYTNNLDPDNDGYLDCDGDYIVDNTAVPGVFGGFVLPDEWNSFTKTQRSNWVGGKSGISHDDFRWVLLPIKVWAESLEKAGLTAPVDNEGVISDEGWYGQNASFHYIPERLAVDLSEEPGNPNVDVGDPNYGSYKKIIASTRYYTNTRRAHEITFGVNALRTGKGPYKGKLFFDLRTN